MLLADLSVAAFPGGRVEARGETVQRSSVATPKKKFKSPIIFS